MRPPEAKSLPQVSQFIRSDIETIVSLKPDLVLGFSDIQKDVARELIGRGLNVFVTNQRSLSEILNNILLLGRIVGAENEAQALIEGFEKKLQEVKQAASLLPRRPRVYFEEWDHPRLSAITWVSELIEVCGGENIFAHKAGSLARERQVSDEEIIVANPDVIFACWCGKAVKLASIQERPGYGEITAIQKGYLWELPPEIFLQPGPALFLDGLDRILAHFQDLSLT